VKLYVVRHGVSTGNTPGLLMGQGDHPLTAVGEAQARAVAARLAPLGPMPVYCSDLLRARATAETIAREWGPASVRPDRRLRELDLGDYEGCGWDEFAGDATLRAALDADPYNTALPGGESLALLAERVLAAMRDIVATCRHEAAAIVAHDGTIRVIVNHHLGVPAEKWWTLSTTHCGVSLLEWTDGWVNVRFVNDTCHLAGLVLSPEDQRDEGS